MKSPRIYTYKVTFEEVPYWYWGVHKEGKYGDGYMGSPTTHRRMWNFYTPHLQILECFPYTEEGWREANLVEDRLIRPDLNNPNCLNEACNLKMSLEAARKGGVATLRKKVGAFGRSPEVWSEDSKKAGKRGGKVAGRKAVENGTGIFSPEHKNKGVETNRRKGTSFWDPDVREKSYQKIRKPVELTHLATGHTFIFSSASEAARHFNLNRGNLCSVCRGIKEKAGGFSAKYITIPETNEQNLPNAG